ncbi:uncharacterized protein [Clytia hemisphaerica]|uniref:uncharacterized protein isoform X2 n=1 Tax=Clytia hemisphaerica TaxID=252671 RepID=UPI0034D58EC3
MAARKPDNGPTVERFKHNFKRKLVDASIRTSPGVISLLSDDDDGEENIKPPSKVKRNINEVEKWKYQSDEYVVPKRRGTAPGVSNKMSKSKSDSAVLRPKNHQLEPLSSNRKMSSSPPLPSHNNDTYLESLTLSALKRIPDTEFKRTTRRTTPTIKQEVLTPDKLNTTTDSAPVSGNDVPTLDTTKQFFLDLCIEGKTLNWNPILPLSTNLKKMTSKKASGKDKRAVFLLKWDNGIESSLDEKDFYPALCLLKENLSEFYYPNAKVISRFMNLLKDQTESFKQMELFCTLQCVPMLHPVKDLTEMYVHMLKNPKQEKREVKETTAMHDTLLEAARDARLILENKEPNSRLLSSCIKQAEFISDLLQNDFNDVIKEIRSQVDIKDTNHHLLKKLRLSLIYQTLWGQRHELALNSTVKEFVEMTVSLYQIKDNSTEALQLRHMFIGLMRVIAECCSVKDKLSTGYYHGNDAKSFCGYFTEYSLLLFKSPGTLHRMKVIFLHEIGDTWITYRVCEALLDRMDSCLVPSRIKDFSEKTMSFDKIISYYFYMYPGRAVRKEHPQLRTSVKDLQTRVAQQSPSNSVSPLVSPKRLNKPNGKGRDLLHLRRADGKTPLDICREPSAMKTLLKRYENVDMSSTNKEMYKTFVSPEPQNMELFLRILLQLITSYRDSNIDGLRCSSSQLEAQYNDLLMHVKLLNGHKIPLKCKLTLKQIKRVLFS